MPAPPLQNLTDDERLTLHVLAWLLLRMGLPERAGRVYAALADAEDAPDRRACAGLAAVELTRPDGDPAVALRWLNAALAGRAPSSREAGLHLMRAQALWRADRTDEARSALAAWRHNHGAEG